MYSTALSLKTKDSICYRRHFCVSGDLRFAEGGGYCGRICSRAGFTYHSIYANSGFVYSYWLKQAALIRSAPFRISSRQHCCSSRGVAGRIRASGGFYQDLSGSHEEREDSSALNDDFLSDSTHDNFRGKYKKEIDSARKNFRSVQRRKSNSSDETTSSLSSRDFRKKDQKTEDTSISRRYRESKRSQDEIENFSHMYDEEDRRKFGGKNFQGRYEKEVDSAGKKFKSVQRSKLNSSDQVASSLSSDLAESSRYFRQNDEKSEKKDQKSENTSISRTFHESVNKTQTQSETMNQETTKKYAEERTSADLLEELRRQRTEIEQLRKDYQELVRTTKKEEVSSTRASSSAVEVKEVRSSLEAILLEELWRQRYEMEQLKSSCQDLMSTIKTEKIAKDSNIRKYSDGKIATSTSYSNQEDERREIRSDQVRVNVHEENTSLTSSSADERRVKIRKDSNISSNTQDRVEILVKEREEVSNSVQHLIKVEREKKVRDDLQVIVESNDQYFDQERTSISTSMKESGMREKMKATQERESEFVKSQRVSVEDRTSVSTSALELGMKEKMQETQRRESEFFKDQRASTKEQSLVSTSTLESEMREKMQATQERESEFVKDQRASKKEQTSVSTSTLELGMREKMQATHEKESEFVKDQRSSMKEQQTLISTSMKESGLREKMKSMQERESNFANEERPSMKEQPSVSTSTMELEMREKMKATLKRESEFVKDQRESMKEQTSTSASTVELGIREKMEATLERESEFVKDERASTTEKTSVSTSMQEYGMKEKIEWKLSPRDESDVTSSSSSENMMEEIQPSYFRRQRSQPSSFAIEESQPSSFHAEEIQQSSSLMESHGQRPDLDTKVDQEQASISGRREKMQESDERESEFEDQIAIVSDSLLSYEKNSEERLEVFSSPSENEENYSTSDSMEKIKQKFSPLDESDSRSSSSSEAMMEESQPSSFRIEESQPSSFNLEESQPSSLHMEESQPSSLLIEESQPSYFNVEESQPSPFRMEESQPSSSWIEESQPQSLYTEESQLSSYQIDESQPSPLLIDGSQPSYFTVEESQPSSFRMEESLLSSSPMDETHPSSFIVEFSPHSQTEESQSGTSQPASSQGQPSASITPFEVPIEEIRPLGFPLTESLLPPSSLQSQSLIDKSKLLMQSQQPSGSPNAESQLPSSTLGKSQLSTSTTSPITTRSGKSLWSFVANVFRVNWRKPVDPQMSTATSATKSSSNESVSSEAWYSGHELEQEEEGRRITIESEPSKLTSGSQSGPSISDASSSGTFKEGESEKRKFLRKSERIRRKEGDAGSDDQSPSTSLEIQSEPLISDSKKSLRRIKQVKRDEVVEWEDAYKMETEQRRIDELFMREALVEAKKAGDMWEVPVGAVLVQDGKIIARGSNLVEDLRDSTAHAEMICIREASNILRSWRLAGTTLYVTLEPCPMCAGAILQARIDTIVWGAPNKLLGADGSWIRLFQGEGMEGPVHPFHPNMKIRRGVLATECADAMQEFFQLRRRKNKTNPPPPPPPPPPSIANYRAKLLTKMQNLMCMMFCM